MYRGDRLFSENVEIKLQEMVRKGGFAMLLLHRHRNQGKGGGWTVRNREIAEG